MCQFDAFSIYKSDKARLVDDDGNEINSYDVRGELCVR